MNWDSNHHIDPLVGDSAYWPRFANGTDSYTSVPPGEGRVTSYTVNMFPFETMPEAILRMRDELPPDSSIVSSQMYPSTSPRCQAVVMTSPTLAARVHFNVVGLMFSPTSAFNSAVVNRIVLGPWPLHDKAEPRC